MLNIYIKTEFNVIICLIFLYRYEIRTADGIIEFTDKTKGPATYDIVEGNCEHYAMLCRYGVKISLQVRMSLHAFTCVCLFHIEMKVDY